MSDNAPVLETLTEMTAVSVEHNTLSPRDYLVARLAALIAVDAPPISWFATAAAVEESGLTLDDVQGIMIAVAPVVGAPRVMRPEGTSSRLSTSPSPSLTPRWPSWTSSNSSPARG
jgi:alkylhydroperoxidase/carboxymuconolactone decarboxylase family protein YurZ